MYLDYHYFVPLYELHMYVVYLYMLIGERKQHASLSLTVSVSPPTTLPVISLRLHSPVCLSPVPYFPVSPCLTRCLWYECQYLATPVVSSCHWWIMVVLGVNDNRSDTRLLWTPLPGSVCPCYTYVDITYWCVIGLAVHTDHHLSSLMSIHTSYNGGWSVEMMS